MKTITALAAKKLGKFLAKDFRRIFGPAQDDMAERLGSFARSTIECLARSDALYTITSTLYRSRWSDVKF